jgi:hypothetical protein
MGVPATWWEQGGHGGDIQLWQCGLVHSERVRLRWLVSEGRSSSVKVRMRVGFSKVCLGLLAPFERRRVRGWVVRYIVGTDRAVDLFPLRHNVSLSCATDLVSIRRGLHCWNPAQSHPGPGSSSRSLGHEVGVTRILLASHGDCTEVAGVRSPHSLELLPHFGTRSRNCGGPVPLCSLPFHGHGRRKWEMIDGH